MSVLNLNQLRKRKAKADASKQAEANRIAHGLSAEQRKQAKIMVDQQTKALDGLKLDKNQVRRGLPEMNSPFDQL